MLHLALDYLTEGRYAFCEGEAKIHDHKKCEIFSKMETETAGNQMISQEGNFRPCFLFDIGASWILFLRKLSIPEHARNGQPGPGCIKGCTCCDKNNLDTAVISSDDPNAANARSGPIKKKKKKKGYSFFRC